MNNIAFTDRELALIRQGLEAIEKLSWTVDITAFTGVALKVRAAMEPNPSPCIYKVSVKDCPWHIAGECHCVKKENHAIR